MVREQRGTTRYLEAGSGTPVVLLHAFPLSADMWRPQLERVPAGWRFLAPDLRGFGGARGRARSMDDMADGVVELLDSLSIDDAILGGLSMGGYVAFALLRREPRRFRGLVLADTRSTADTKEGRAGRTKMLATLRKKGVPAVADEMLPKLLGETSRRDRPDLEARVRAIIEPNTADGVGGAVEAMRGRPDSTPLLATLHLPALVLVGDEDTLTPPADSEAMAAQLPRATLARLRRAGHLSNLETPDEFSAALADFLETL